MFPTKQFGKTPSFPIQRPTDKDFEKKETLFPHEPREQPTQQAPQVGKADTTPGVGVPPKFEQDEGMLLGPKHPVFGDQDKDLTTEDLTSRPKKTESEVPEDIKRPPGSRYDEFGPPGTKFAEPEA